MRASLPGAPLEVQTAVEQLRSNLVKTTRLARSKNQKQVRDVTREFDEGIENNLVFIDLMGNQTSLLIRAHGARCDPDVFRTVSVEF